MRRFDTYRESFPNARLTRSKLGVLEVALHTGGGTLIFDGHTHEQFVDLFHAIGSDPDNRVVILYLVAPKGRIFVLAPVPLVDELPIPAPQITFCARRRARDATKRRLGDVWSDATRNARARVMGSYWKDRHMPLAARAGAFAEPRLGPAAAARSERSQARRVSASTVANRQVQRPRLVVHHSS